uniref:Uncharacterized protein n=1 Tax=Ditylenchus dipsaci TaxID=166011 RepID=A0A915E414_9BILA
MFAYILALLLGLVIALVQLWGFSSALQNDPSLLTFQASFLVMCGFVFIQRVSFSLRNQLGVFKRAVMVVLAKWIVLLSSVFEGILDFLEHKQNMRRQDPMQRRLQILELLTTPLSSFIRMASFSGLWNSQQVCIAVKDILRDLPDVRIEQSMREKVQWNDGCGLIRFRGALLGIIHTLALTVIIYNTRAAI